MPKNRAKHSNTVSLLATQSQTNHAKHETTEKPSKHSNTHQTSQTRTAKHVSPRLFRDGETRGQNPRKGGAQAMTNPGKKEPPPTEPTPTLMPTAALVVPMPRPGETDTAMSHVYSFAIF